MCTDLLRGDKLFKLNTLCQDLCFVPNQLSQGLPVYSLWCTGVTSITANIHFIQNTKYTTSKASTLVSILVNRSKHLDIELILFHPLENSSVSCCVLSHTGGEAAASRSVQSVHSNLYQDRLLTRA